MAEHPSVDSISVGSLVRQAKDRDADPWELALVQRDRVWDWVRVARLLDSLLAGYPIGTILLVRLRGAEDDLVPVLDAQERTAREVPRSRWQLLDGQQRLNAIAALYSHVPEHGRYYLDLTAERPAESELATRRRQRIAATNYVRFRRASLSEDYDPIPGRNFHLDLSGFGEWASRGGEPALAALKQLAGRPSSRARDGDYRRLVDEALVRARSASGDPKSWRSDLGFLADIDADCHVGDPTVIRDSQLSQVAERTVHLLQSWFAEVPVERKVLATEFDILQVFERINLAGVRVAGEDVFFAAIKTRWPRADEVLRSFTEDVRILGQRRSALRLLARLASLAAGRGDSLPLRVDRLNPPRGQELRQRIEALAAPGGARRRMRALSEALIDRSGLGYALRDEIPGVLIDAVLAWAATSTRGEEPDFVDTSLPAATGFLLGATTYGYWQALGTGFAELAMLEAARAGTEGEPFPAERIVARSVERFGQSLSRRFVAVRDSADADQRLALVNANRHLFVTLAHQLPYELPVRTRRGAAVADQRREVEWDHIWPQDQRRQFRYGRRYQHGSDRVGHAGNFWILDAPLNNHARTSLPSNKFDFLRDPTTVHALPDVWPPSSPVVITDDERATFASVEALVQAGERTEETVATGTELFAQLIDRRGQRLFDLLAGELRYGQWQLFARSTAASVDFPLEGLSSRRLAAKVSQAMDLPAPSTQRAITEGTSSLDVLMAAAAQAGVEADLQTIDRHAREVGFYVSTRRTHLRPYRYHLAVALNRTGWRRRDLCTIQPDQEAQGFRVRVSLDNIRAGVGMDRAAVWRAFGAEGDRVWTAGTGLAFVHEVLEPLARVVRGGEIVA